MFFPSQQTKFGSSSHSQPNEATLVFTFCWSYFLLEQALVRSRITLMHLVQTLIFKYVLHSILLGLQHISHFYIIVTLTKFNLPLCFPNHYWRWALFANITIKSDGTQNQKGFIHIQMPKGTLTDVTVCVHPNTITHTITQFEVQIHYVKFVFF